MDQRMEEALRNALHQREKNTDGRMESVLEASRKELEKRAAHRRIGFGSFLIRQIGFIGWRTWLVQAAVLLAMIAGLRTALIFDMKDFEPRHIPALLSCCGVMTALASSPMLGRAARFRMLEMESAARYSFPYIVAARLILVAAGDALMLLGITAFAAVRTDIGILGILFYAAVPFAILSGTALLLLPYVPARAGSGLIWAAGILEMGIIWLLNQFCPWFAFLQFGPVWALLCAVLLIGGGWSAARALKRETWAEQCFAAI